MAREVYAQKVIQRAASSGVVLCLPALIPYRALHVLPNGLVIWRMLGGQHCGDQKHQSG